MHNTNETNHIRGTMQILRAGVQKRLPDSKMTARNLVRHAIEGGWTPEEVAYLYAHSLRAIEKLQEGLDEYGEAVRAGDVNGRADALARIKERMEKYLILC